MDKRFYTHIQNNRTDAALQSLNGGLPDYYGEKIYSVTDYRAWLKKQREHRTKSAFGGLSSKTYALRHKSQQKETDKMAQQAEKEMLDYKPPFEIKH